MKASLASAELAFGRDLAFVRDLAPGSFAFVMATGILSAAESIFGQRWPSAALFGIALAGFVVLCALSAARLIRFPKSVWEDTARPQRAFGFFTFVAGSNVLAANLAAAGWTTPARALAVVAALVWLFLAYLIVARVVLSERKPEPEAAVNGTWLIWVVGTQSVSIAASAFGTGVGLPPPVAALLAVSLWGFGALLYLLLMAIIFARLALARLDPIEATPPYWISMGATAITVLAGAELLRLPADLPSVAAARATIEGLTLCLWAFGTWWFPFLILLTVWRYRKLAHRVYEESLWSMVFPLGMYAVATAEYGQAAGLPLLSAIAGAEVWLAVVCWLLVAAWMVMSWVTGTRPRLKVIGG